jgi:phosphoenolpyruvate synthase/pyruvate phosphate dikinase
MTEIPLYNAMAEAVQQGVAEAEAFIENATIDDIETLVRIATDHEPERKLREIRTRAEKGARTTMRELDDSMREQFGLTPCRRRRGWPTT